MDRIQDILDFWFLPESDKNYGKQREVWFKKNSDFDAEIRQKFLGDFEKAEAGELLHWTESARGSLALILLFDQFTRNMFRDSSRAFAADGKAREIARHMLSRGWKSSSLHYHLNIAKIWTTRSYRLNCSKNSDRKRPWTMLNGTLTLLSDLDAFRIGTSSWAGKVRKRKRRS